MQSLSAAAFIFQDNTAALTSDVHSLMIAQWIIAICIAAVLIGLLGAIIGVYILVRKLEARLEKATKSVQARAIPLVGQGQDIMAKVQEIIADLKPKIASVTDDVQHISGVVKAKVDEAGQTFTQVNETVQDVNGKTKDQVQRVNGLVKDQVQRVNGMVSEALTTTEHVAQTIQHGIKVPVLKIAGWVAAARVGIENLADKIPFLHHVAPPLRDEEDVPFNGTTTTVAPGGPPFVPPAPTTKI